MGMSDIQVYGYSIYDLLWIIDLIYRLDLWEYDEWLYNYYKLIEVFILLHMKV